MKQPTWLRRSGKKVEERLRRTALKPANTAYYKHAALLFVRGKLVAVAYNHEGECAELRLLRKIPRGADPDDLVIVTGRFTKKGVRRYGKPCRQCEQEIRRRGIALVFYSAEGQEMVGNSKRPSYY